VFVVGLVAAALGAGIGTYYIVEKPLLRASKGLLAARRSTIAAASVERAEAGQTSSCA
jgi:peptidoglycan/LPS O-acetylase OafA/YrhL